MARVRDLETASGGGTLDFFSLAAGKAARHMEPFIITVHPGEDRELSEHEGEEFMYVLDGTIEVEYGKDLYTLTQGDSIYLDSIVPHQVRGGSPVARPHTRRRLRAVLGGREMSTPATELHTELTIGQYFDHGRRRAARPRLRRLPRPRPAMDLRRVRRSRDGAGQGAARHRPAEGR